MGRGAAAAVHGWQSAAVLVLQPGRRCESRSALCPATPRERAHLVVRWHSHPLIACALGGQAPVCTKQAARPETVSTGSSRAGSGKSKSKSKSGRDALSQRRVPVWSGRQRNSSQRLRHSHDLAKSVVHVAAAAEGAGQGQPVVCCRSRRAAGRRAADACGHRNSKQWRTGRALKLSARPQEVFLARHAPPPEGAAARARRVGGRLGTGVRRGMAGAGCQRVGAP